MTKRTMFEKIWDNHVIHARGKQAEYYLYRFAACS